MLYKASGGFDYVDRETYRQAPTGPLLTVEQARRFAVPFLRSHGLLPSGTLRISARADATVVVVTATPLLSGAPVLDGAITFWLGAGGAITRLRDEYRPLAAPVRVAARPNAAILKEVRDDLGTTTGIRLRLAYVAQPSYLDQPYLDPVFEAVAQGLVLDRVRATTFTPRVEITSPSASTPILAGDLAALRAKAIEGRGPYRYTWSANATGFLGNGKAVDVALAAADTEIRLTVRDASGAGTTYAQPVSVIGPAAGTPAAPQSGGTYGDGTVSFEAEQDQTHPLRFKDVRAGGVQRESDVYFDQFRYALTVRFQSTDYHVTSRKCVPLTTRATPVSCRRARTPSRRARRLRTGTPRRSARRSQWTTCRAAWSCSSRAARRPPTAARAASWGDRTRDALEVRLPHPQQDRRRLPRLSAFAGMELQTTGGLQAERLRASLSSGRRNLRRAGEPARRVELGLARRRAPAGDRRLQAQRLHRGRLARRRHRACGAREGRERPAPPRGQRRRSGHFVPAVARDGGRTRHAEPHRCVRLHRTGRHRAERRARRPKRSRRLGRPPPEVREPRRVRESCSQAATTP